MILIDSSALIEYYRAEGNENYKRWISESIEADLTAINALIWTEILAFTKSQIEYDLIVSDFSSFYWLPLDKSVSNRAAQLGFQVRRKGVTIPPTDLLIYACAVVHDADLIHYDNHFNEIAAFEPLKMKSML